MEADSHRRDISRDSLQDYTKTFEAETTKSSKVNQLFRPCCVAAAIKHIDHTVHSEATEEPTDSYQSEKRPQEMTDIKKEEEAAVAMGNKEDKPDGIDVTQKDGSGGKDDCSDLTDTNAEEQAPKSFPQKVSRYQSHQHCVMD